MLRRNDKKITAHMVVKNEDQWIWFAIMSVIDYVEKIIIFDTGSNDKTVEIIESILLNEKYQNKIIFEEVGNVTKKEFTELRQRQINMTETEYMFIVDGDEIWWKEAIEELKEIIARENPLVINTKFIVPVMDVFHYRDFSREQYSVGGLIGSITTRVLSLNIEGLSCVGNYGVEGYHGVEGAIPEAYPQVTMRLEYFHCSKLQRSSSLFGDEQISYRRKKIFDDWDYEFSKEYKYPEVFYFDRPDIVPDPFKVKDNFLKRTAKRIIRVYRICMKKRDSMGKREKTVN